MFRKTIGFFVGAGICFILIMLIFSESNAVPRGIGWLIMVIGAGSLGASMFSRPAQARAAATQAMVPIKLKWWGLAWELRLVLIVCAIWIAGAYGLQDEYGKSEKLILLPPVLLLIFYFLKKHLVNNR